MGTEGFARKETAGAERGGAENGMVVGTVAGLLREGAAMACMGRCGAETQDQCVCVHVRVCVSVCVCACVFMHVYTWVHAYNCKYGHVEHAHGFTTRVHACMGAHKDVCMHTHVQMHLRAPVCMYTCVCV